MKKHTQDQSFIEGKGFYIALCSCIAVLGIIAYAGHSAGKEKAKKQASDNIVMEDTSTPVPIPTQIPVYTARPNTAAVINSPAPAAVKKAETPKSNVPKPSSSSKTIETAANQASTVPPEPPKTPEFLSPAEGKIITTFSADLTYNKTMDDWRTHDGVDIQLDAGREIKAAYDGTVDEIGTNALGTFITINHTGGWQTIYANLDEESIKLKKDDTVKTGDVIGKLGNSTIEEKLLNSHLHLEILKDGENKNPMDYIK